MQGCYHHAPSADVLFAEFPFRETSFRMFNNVPISFSKNFRFWQQFFKFMVRVVNVMVEMIYFMISRGSTEFDTRDLHKILNILRRFFRLSLVSTPQNLLISFDIFDRFLILILKSYFWPQN